MRLNIKKIHKAVDDYRVRIVILLPLVLLCFVLIVSLFTRQSDPIPPNIISAVPFTIYYPSSSTLPSQYSLSSSSIRVPAPGVVLFNVTYGINQNITISEEAQPADSVVSNFISSYIPLHNSFSTPIGSAVMGAYNDGKSIRSVISLTVDKGPWVIATAPSNIDRYQFEQVIDSLTKS